MERERENVFFFFFAYLFGLVLDENALTVLPPLHELYDISLHVRGDLGLEMVGLEEGPDEPMDLLL